MRLRSTGAGLAGLALVAALAASASSCASPPAEARTAPAPPEVVWNPLGQWTGNGSLQTESFTGATGSLRIRWSAKDAARKKAKDGKGALAITIHSAISGRPLALAVDHTGAGEDVAYVQEDPRIFFAVVESSDLDWTFTIEEALTR